MKIAICYHSVSGRTARMAQAIAAGMQSAQPDVEVRCISITELTKEHPENLEFVTSASGVLIGTPDYYAGESFQIKQWLDACPCKLAGKLAGCFATANSLVGGPAIAIEHVLTHLMVQGALTYSGGSSYGQPFIHLGPICYAGREEEGEELMKIFGGRFAGKVQELFN